MEEKAITFGEKAADKIAKFGGSWTFLISFSVCIFIWVVINTFILLNNAFDPYPFILLNLILSMLASIQAPIIMMSQRRQEARDRNHIELDFEINKKAELEIELLNKKLDALIEHHAIDFEK